MTDETSIPAAPSATGDEPTVATDAPRTERLAAEAPISAWFLGPKSEHSAAWRELLEHVLQDYLHWRRNYFPMDPLIVGHSLRREQAHWLDGLNEELDKLVSKLKAGVPFFHPRYLAHMTSEATLPSVVGYFAAMLYNANNVTDEAGPATVDLEGEVGEMLATMVGFNPTRSWSHVTSGGTVANVEALWVARQAQFVTLGLRDLCREKRWELSIDDAPGGPAELSKLGDVAALQMRPAVALQLPARLARKLRTTSVLPAPPRSGLRQTRTAMLRRRSPSSGSSRRRRRRRRRVRCARHRCLVPPRRQSSASGHEKQLAPAHDVFTGCDAEASSPAGTRGRA